MEERRFELNTDEISNEQIRDEILGYKRRMEEVLGRKGNLRNRVKALAIARREIGQLDIEDPGYVVGFFKLRILDDLGQKLSLGIEFVGPGSDIGDSTKRAARGPESGRRTPKF